MQQSRYLEKLGRYRRSHEGLVDLCGDNEDVNVAVRMHVVPTRERTIHKGDLDASNVGESDAKDVGRLDKLPDHFTQRSPSGHVRLHDVSNESPVGLSHDQAEPLKASKLQLQ